MRYFTFGSIDSRTYNAYIFEGATFGSPQKSYTSQDVPGKNGSVLINNKRYQNTDHDLWCIITGDLGTNLTGLRNALMSQDGYQRLEDSSHPDEYYMAVLREELAVEVNPTEDMAKFRIRFNRKPQRFLKSGETPVNLTSTGSVTNPTMMNAKPLLRVYGTGRVTVGDISVLITAANEYTDIDCDIMEAYKGATSCNANIQLSGNEFPLLKPGVNAITLGTGITRVIVTPRWWRI